ncbi:MULTISPECIES: class III lanthipeptide [Bacillus cereus group]|uniref:Class III lanthipeptide n=1 Tax=Bacillus paramobilis TaxID=2817477 RepID=A0ABZ2VL40_9BACI|nr:class III lanthipeptide [Bacillus cereus]
MKDVLALQQLNEGTDVQPEWPTASWTVTGFMSTVSNTC